LDACEAPTIADCRTGPGLSLRSPESEIDLFRDDYTTFLKHFGEFKVAKIDKTEVSGQEYIIEELHSLSQTVARLDVSTRRQAMATTPRRKLMFVVTKSLLNQNGRLQHFVLTTKDVDAFPVSGEDDIVLEIPASSPSANELRRILAEGTVEAVSAATEAT
jgi:hypothetical protein